MLAFLGREQKNGKGGILRGKRDLPVRKRVSYWTPRGLMAMTAFVLFNAGMIAWLIYALRQAIPTEPTGLEERKAHMILLVGIWLVGGAGLAILALSSRRTKIVRIERDERGRKIVRND